MEIPNQNSGNTPLNDEAVFNTLPEVFIDTTPSDDQVSEETVRSNKPQGNGLHIHLKFCRDKSSGKRKSEKKPVFVPYHLIVGSDQRVRRKSEGRRPSLTTPPSPCLLLSTNTYQTYKPPDINITKDSKKCDFDKQSERDKCSATTTVSSSSSVPSPRRDKSKHKASGRKKHNKKEKTKKNSLPEKSFDQQNINNFPSASIYVPYTAPQMSPYSPMPYNSYATGEHPSYTPMNRGDNAQNLQQSLTAQNPLQQPYFDNQKKDQQQGFTKPGQYTDVLKSKFPEGQKKMYEYTKQSTGVTRSTLPPARKEQSFRVPTRDSAKIGNAKSSKSVNASQARQKRVGAGLPTVSLPQEQQAVNTPSSTPVAAYPTSQAYYSPNLAPYSPNMAQYSPNMAQYSPNMAQYSPNVTNYSSIQANRSSTTSVPLMGHSQASQAKGQYVGQGGQGIPAEYRRAMTSHVPQPYSYNLPQSNGSRIYYNDSNQNAINDMYHSHINLVPYAYTDTGLPCFSFTQVVPRRCLSNMHKEPDKSSDSDNVSAHGRKKKNKHSKHKSTEHSSKHRKASKS